MSDTWEDALAGVVVAVTGLALAFGIAFVFSYLGCRSKALGMQLDYSFGPFQGCLVTRMDGVIVPIENYGRADRD